jgi:hypothetical protein
MHVLFIFEKIAPFIPNADLRNIWGHGFVNVRALRGDVDDVGRYLTAYLTDIAIDSDDTSNPPPSSDDAKNKKFVKGGRLALYPTGFRFFRCSKGVKRPTTTWTHYKTAVSKLNPFTLKSSYFFQCEIPNYIDKRTQLPKIVTFGNWYYNAVKKITNPLEQMLSRAFTLGIPVNNIDNKPRGVEIPKYKYQQYQHKDKPLVTSNRTLQPLDFTPLGTPQVDTFTMPKTFSISSYLDGLRKIAINNPLYKALYEHVGKSIKPKKKRNQD